MDPSTSTPADCPTRLEYLSQIDQVLIHQQIELLEVLTTFENSKKYKINNILAQRIHFAVEDSDFLYLKLLWGFYAFCSEGS